MSRNVTLERAKAGQDIEWLEATIGDIAGTAPVSPITVEGDQLLVESSQLDVEKVYTFHYLDANMVLWKLPDGTIDLYQVLK